MEFVNYYILLSRQMKINCSEKIVVVLRTTVAVFHATGVRTHGLQRMLVAVARLLFFGITAAGLSNWAFRPFDDTVAAGAWTWSTTTTTIVSSCSSSFAGFPYFKHASIFCRDPGDGYELTALAELPGMGLPAALDGRMQQLVHPDVKDEVHHMLQLGLMRL